VSHDPWLEEVQLLDCTGQVSHTLTLQPDGMVAIRFNEGHTAIVDPIARRCLTPGMHLHDDLITAAAALRQ
jgi:hypothetical protein